MAIGQSFLSKSPLSIDTGAGRKARDTEELARTVLSRWDSLKSVRANWDTLWREVAEVVWPNADRFLGDERARGEKNTRNRIDASSTLANIRHASVLQSLLTPSQSIWHRLKASIPELNKSPEVRTWFEDTNKTLFQTRAAPTAAFYANRHVANLSLGAFGNAATFIDAVPGGGIRYSNWHVGTVWIELNEFGLVDTLYHEVEITHKQFDQLWGENGTRRKMGGTVYGLHESMREKLNDKPFTRAKFLQAIVPRTDIDPERKDFRGMPFETQFIDMENKHLIEEHGYEEFPATYARYTVNPGEVYGRGPAIQVLPSINLLQEMKRTFLRAGHKVVNPPLLVADVMGRGGSRPDLRPGGITQGGLDLAGRPKVVPLQSGARIDLTAEMMDAERKIIDTAFLVDLFQILTETPQMTATEALIRAQEKGQHLAPVVERLQVEDLGPMIEREVAILQRQGLLLPMPEELIEAAGEYEITYESPATRFQRTEELLGFQRTYEQLGQLIQITGDQSLAQVVDPIEAARSIAELNGISTDLVRSVEELQKISADAAEAAQAEQAAAAAPGLAGAASDLANAGATIAPAPETVQ